MQQKLVLQKWRSWTIGYFGENVYTYVLFESCLKVYKLIYVHL